MTTASVVPAGPSPGAAGAPGKAKISGLAIASLVAGIFGLCTAGLGGIAGLILGVTALKRIGRSGGALRGRALAIVGLIVSTCTLLLWVLAAAIGGVWWQGYERDYYVPQARRALSEVESALNRYQDDIGHPPTAEEGGLRALIRQPTLKDQPPESKWKGPYLNRGPGGPSRPASQEVEVPLDPWGHRLNYKPLPSSPGTPYRLWSSGPDGISGTPDDISLDSSEKGPAAEVKGFQ